MYLLYTQFIYLPVRPKTNRALRHVQMRQLDLSKFKKFTRSIRQKEIQIVKEQPKKGSEPFLENALPVSDAKGALTPFCCNSVFAKLVEPDGIEPTTSCVQGRRSPS